MPDAEPSLTINEFCQLERICRATYYNLRRAGVGPDEILVGSHPRITAAARRRRPWAAVRCGPRFQARSTVDYPLSS